MKTSQRILNYINNYVEENGYSPTVREIGTAMDLRSSSTVHGHLERLQEKGLLSKMDDKIPRTWKTLKDAKSIVEENGIPTEIEWQGFRYKLIDDTKT